MISLRLLATLGQGDVKVPIKDYTAQNYWSQCFLTFPLPVVQVVDPLACYVQTFEIQKA